MSKRSVALGGLFVAVATSLAAQGGKEGDRQAIAVAQRTGNFEAAGATPFRLTAKFQTVDYRGQASERWHPAGDLSQTRFSQT